MEEFDILSNRHKGIQKKYKMIKSEYNIYRKAFVYTIKLNNKIVYVGSTTDPSRRTIDHNKYLKIAKLANGGDCLRLYGFLYDKIDKIELNIVKEFYDDIVLIDNYTIEYRRYIEEEKCIRHCLNKGFILLNINYPCRTWINIDGSLDRRLEPKSSKIEYSNIYYNRDCDLYNKIYDFHNQSPFLKSS